MIVSGKDAWRENATIREWFEVVFDTTVDPHNHSAYICKCCWQQFESNINAISLLSHASRHGSQGEAPYSTARLTQLTGERLLSCSDS